MSIRCYYCGGTTAAELVDDLYAENGVYVAVEHVPADVCQQCGERFYGPHVVDRLLELTAHAKRSAPVGVRAHVLVFDCAAAAPTVAA
jgi:YgiT-type zinc finger domain-containing protein